MRGNTPPPIPSNECFNGGTSRGISPPPPPPIIFNSETSAKVEGPVPRGEGVKVPPQNLTNVSLAKLQQRLRSHGG